MKKIVLLFAVIVLVLCLGACNREMQVDDGKINIVCTSHVVVDWVENLACGVENTNVTVLADKGKDMHNFQPSAADIKLAYSSDLLIYIGGQSDIWVSDMLENGNIENSLKLIEFIDGEHCDDCLDGHDHDHDEAPDEHIWLSFENTQACISEISDALCELDVENADTYRENFEEYSSSVEALKNEYVEAVKNAKYRTLVFADRFPFVYLMNELELEYFAAFPGCSSETTASFDTIITLAQAVDEKALPCILTIEDSTDGIAERVAEYVSGEVTILALDSMQIYKADEGFGYVDVMEENLEILKMALGE